ncbi:MAG: hypothetical protein HYZ59_04560 [Actinobacteria bacterium]|nr:hypothetical protein [Actinomycetota bacterium]
MAVSAALPEPRPPRRRRRSALGEPDEPDDLASVEPSFVGAESGPDAGPVFFGGRDREVDFGAALAALGGRGGAGIESPIWGLRTRARSAAAAEGRFSLRRSGNSSGRRLASFATGSPEAEDEISPTGP